MTTTNTQTSSLDSSKLYYEEIPDKPHVIKIKTPHRNYIKEYFVYLIEVILK
jgi:hypothetical protein